MSEELTTSRVKITVQTADFDLAQEYAAIANDNADGAVVTFCGKVRDFNDNCAITSLTLEHYSGMTEAVLEKICLEAKSRWPLNYLTIIHRVGTLALGDQIVFIGVSSAHRKAPFWKLEASPDGERWLDARETDAEAASHWQED
jgi:molybdopterin synthase catalytic subunit